MKISITVLFFIAFNTLCFGQTLKVNQLSTIEIDSIYNNSLKNKLQIDFAIFRVYQYQDKSGLHEIVMTEKDYVTKNGKKDSEGVKAYSFRISEGNRIQEWKLKDYIIPTSNEEYSITFWTKYFEIKDYDGDGLADPILIYGTRAMNDYDDGRIKILTFHKGLKRAIRHQNGVQDNERNTQVDQQFYKLPTKIQERVKKVIELMTENNHAIFPYGWQEAMKNKELKFDENN